MDDRASLRPLNVVLQQLTEREPMTDKDNAEKQDLAYVQSIIDDLVAEGLIVGCGLNQDCQMVYKVTEALGKIAREK
jgi:hypothetical protein